MLQELNPSRSNHLFHYNPDKGLKTITTATAAERYWKQAKDSHQLLQAIRGKLMAQAEHVIWRDSVVVPSRQNGAPGRGKRVSMRRSVLPGADPGHKVAHKWRKKLCSRTGNSTRIDRDKLDQELKNILSRCLFICEFENKYGMTHDDEILKAAKAINKKRYEKINAERIKKIIDISKGNKNLGIDKTYPVIYADPPWNYDIFEKSSSSPKAHYPSMLDEDIKAMPVAKLASPDAVLFLWTPSAVLKRALEVVEAWGFEYKSTMVWAKDLKGLGYYCRAQHEILLIATRGRIPTPLPKNRPSSLVYQPRGRHSEKPPCFYKIIETMYTGLDRIELFARKQYPGWSVFGNQATEKVAVLRMKVAV